jgi:hypothetical protein
MAAWQVDIHGNVWPFQEDEEPQDLFGPPTSPNESSQAAAEQISRQQAAREEQFRRYVEEMAERSRIGLQRSLTTDPLILRNRVPQILKGTMEEQSLRVGNPFGPGQGVIGTDASEASAYVGRPDRGSMWKCFRESIAAAARLLAILALLSFLLVTRTIIESQAAFLVATATILFITVVVFWVTRDRTWLRVWSVNLPATLILSLWNGRPLQPPIKLDSVLPADLGVRISRWIGLSTVEAGLIWLLAVGSLFLTVLWTYSRIE